MPDYEYSEAWYDTASIDETVKVGDDSLAIGDDSASAGLFLLLIFGAASVLVSIVKHWSDAVAFINRNANIIAPISKKVTMITPIGGEK